MTRGSLHYGSEKERDRTILVWCLFLALASAFLVFISLPWQRGDLGLRAGADTLLYICDIPLRGYSVFYNTYIPSLVYRLLGSSPVLVFIMNVLLVGLSGWAVVRSCEIRAGVFWGLILFNPLTLSGVTLLNKEIFGLAGACFFITYLQKRNFALLAAALVLSYVARWQQAGVTVVFLVLEHFCERDPRRWGLAFLCLLGVLSVVYPLVLSDSATFMHYRAEQASLTPRIGVTNFLNTLQEGYLYWLVFPAKFTLNLVKQGLDVFLFRFRYEDFYNSILMGGSELFFLLALTAGFLKRKFTLDDPLVAFSVLYGIIYSINLNTHHRLFYPLLACLACILARKRFQSFPVERWRL